MAAIAACTTASRMRGAGTSRIFWTVLRDPAQHAGACSEGLISTARIILLGLEHGRDLPVHACSTQFYPGRGRDDRAPARRRSLFVLLRGSSSALARWWLARQAALDDGMTSSGSCMDDVTAKSKSGPDLRRAVVAPHRHVVPAHAHERRPHADVGDPHLAVADRFGFTIFQVFEKLREPERHRPRGRAAQFRHRAGRARHR